MDRYWTFERRGEPHLIMRYRGNRLTERLTKDEPYWREARALYNNVVEEFHDEGYTEKSRSEAEQYIKQLGVAVSVLDEDRSATAEPITDI